MSEKSSHSYPFSCPYADCFSFPEDPKSRRVVRRGSFWRKDDSKWIPRFQCLRCNRSFSSSRLTPSFGQHKRTVNSKVAELSSSDVSLRRIARILRINVKTVARKLVFLGSEAKKKRLEFLNSLGEESIESFQFDEMETFEKTKCLPLSIALAVEPQTRKILSFRVGKMPAKGLLAEISRKKYGPREDQRKTMATELFREISPQVSPTCKILTDEKPQYPSWVRSVFPKARHKTVKGRRARDIGQGELKKGGFDPLFSFNHTAAMLRANINRLVRRTWCTTKRIDRLIAHIEIYIQYHNEKLT